MKNTVWHVALSLALAMGLLGTAVAQPKETASSADSGTTLRKFRDTHPEQEQGPELMRITDSERRPVSVPVIKTTPTSTPESDRMSEKIKAIKYLGTVACGCSPHRDKIKAALLAALSDDNADVRRAAAEAIFHAVENPCEVCHTCTCSGKDVTKKLAEMAEGKTASGSWLESSAAVRTAAASALAACQQERLPALVPPLLNTNAPALEPPKISAAQHVARLLELVDHMSGSSEPAGYAEAVADPGEPALLNGAEEPILITGRTAKVRPAESQNIRMLPISFAPEIKPLHP
jgi:hypothetical protein